MYDALTAIHTNTDDIAKYQHIYIDTYNTYEYIRYTKIHTIHAKYQQIYIDIHGYILIHTIHTHTYESIRYTRVYTD